MAWRPNTWAGVTIKGQNTIFLSRPRKGKFPDGSPARMSGSMGLWVI